MIEVAYWDGTSLHRTPYCSDGEIVDLPVVVAGEPYVFPPNGRAQRLPTVWHDCDPVEVEGSWREWAVCAGDEGWWDLPFEVQRSDCSVCPVASQCLEAQLWVPTSHFDDAGTWGGTDKGARARIRKMAYKRRVA